jgi:hypothetical protein
MAIHHEVSVEELDDYLKVHEAEWKRFAGSHGNGADKRLEFAGNGVYLYRVTHFGTTVYIGGVKETAVREYNALP